MNVLIFVMTMLMLLALMTYSRLDAFRGSQVFQSIFKYYMEVDERGYYNVKAQPVYDSIKVQTKDGNAGAKGDGSPRLGIKLLVDPKLRESQAKEWLQTKVILKNLINTLYQDQPFYKKAVEKRYSLIDDLINAITHAVDKLPKGQEIKKASDLANLKLADPELDQFLYKILQGASYREITPIKPIDKQKESTESVEAEVDQSQADQSLAEEANEYKSIKGYYSLLDFVTTGKTPKIRIFLAPREVLESVFGNSQIVDSIITDRKQFYRQAVGGGELKDLSNSFKEQYDRYKDPSITEESLDFSVTKTNPKNYE